MAEAGLNNLKIKFRTAVESGAGFDSAFKDTGPGLMAAFASSVAVPAPVVETPAPQDNQVPDVNMEVINRALETDTPENLKPEVLRSGLDAREVGRDIKTAQTNIEAARQEAARVMDPKNNNDQPGPEASGGATRAAAGAGLGLLAGGLGNTVLPGIVPASVTLALAVAPVAKEIMTQVFGQGSFGAPTASAPVASSGKDRPSDGYVRSASTSAPASDKVNALLSGGFGRVLNVGNFLNDDATKLGPAAQSKLEPAIADLSVKAKAVQESSDAFEKRAKGFTVEGAVAVQTIKDRDLNLQGDSADIKNGKLVVYNNMA